jgi:lipoprotein-anchoring transpeptidase ErfK/SrfK
LAVAAVAAAGTALGSQVVTHTTRSRTALAAAVARHPSTTATTLATTTTTVDTVAPAAAFVVPPNGLGVGSSGAAVVALKQRLTELRYDPGPLNEHFDYATYYAVIAFQKVHLMARTGRVTPDLAAAMVTAGLPDPMIPGAEPTRVEIDLTRQVLFFWEGGKLSRILPVSSGYGGHYCGKDGSCGIAITPTGSYRATSKILGKHTSTLGELWNPVFFNGGIAVHGEPAVPSTPASHGCIRIPMNDSMWVYDRMAIGMPVYVRDDSHTPTPFALGGTVGAQQPGGTPPTLPRRTTTTPPKTTTTTNPTTSTTAKPTTPPTA